jgi:small GTP-binding protein
MLVPWNGTENNIKVVFLGESGVGKSCLATRFVSNTYLPYGDFTVGASYLTKTMPVVPLRDASASECDCVDTTNKKSSFKNEKCQKCSAINPTVTFKIWDTAGQEKFHSLVPMYYRGAGAAVLVFDLTRPETMLTLRSWVDELNDNGPPGLVLVLCGNKSDLCIDRRVDRTSAEVFAREIGAFYIEASARFGVNVDTIFSVIADRVSAVDRAAVSQHMCTCTDGFITLESLECIATLFNSSPQRTCC